MAEEHYNSRRHGVSKRANDTSRQNQDCLAKVVAAVCTVLSPVLSRISISNKEALDLKQAQEFEGRKELLERTIGQGSAVVYKLKSESALKASAPDILYWPAGSVRMLVQLLIAAISPA